MIKFTQVHVINCGEEEFWRLFFDRDFNEKQFRDDLGYPEYRVLEQTETPDKIVRRYTATPKLDLPAAVAKIVGSGFRFEEQGVLDKATRRWSWKLVPSALSGKLRTEGTMRVEPAGEGKVKRISDVTVEVKLFGIGGLIESTTEKQIRDGWDRSAVWFNRYLENRA